MSSFQPSVPPVDPDSALADLEATFAATVDPPSLIVVQDEPPPLGKSWAFDWPSMRFNLGNNGDSPLETRGMLTLIQWAEKCLRTARGAHPIHPPNYGLVDPKSIFGQPVAFAPIAELEARIKDALTFHPRIVDVTDFDSDFDPDDEWVAISFTIVVDDETRLPVTTNLSLTSPGITT